MKNNIQQSIIQEINTLHGELEVIVKTGLDKAIRVGELLSECKGVIPHGQFSKWVVDNVRFSIRTAQNYMKLHDNRDRIATADSVVMAYRLLKNETVSLSTAHPPTFDGVQGSLTTYVEGQENDDLDDLAASDHCEKVSLWMESTATSLDKTSVAEVMRFEEQLSWIHNKFNEAHLIGQRRLGSLLGEIQNWPTNKMSTL